MLIPAKEGAVGMGVENVRRGLCMGIILIMNSLGQNGQRMVGEELGDAEIVALWLCSLYRSVIW